MPGDKGRRRDGMIAKGTSKFGRRMMNMFIILIMVMLSWVYTYVKSSYIVNFKYGYFTMCQLYLNKAVL